MDLVAECRRSGRWWAIEVPSVRGLHTQARRLDQVEAMVLDAASLLLERPESDFTVTVRPILDDADATAVESAKLRLGQLRDAEADAALTNRKAVAQLRARGLPVRDVATIMGVSPQRVSKLGA